MQEISARTGTDGRIGDELLVKAIEFDEKGRLNLSRRDALDAVEG